MSKRNRNRGKRTMNHNIGLQPKDAPITAPYDFSKISVIHEMMGPDLAEEFLERNTHNRPVDSKTVEKYASDMLEGRWRYEGSPIKFDYDGVMLDGQTRCMAVILANKMSSIPIAIPVTILTGLEPDSQYSMDIGKKRTLRDHLSLRDAPNYSRLAPMVNILVRFNLQTTATSVVSDTQTQAFYEMHVDTLSKVVDSFTHQVNGSGINQSIMLASRWLIEQYCADVPAIDTFFDGLMSGVNLPPGSPILALRTRMVMAKGNREYISNIAITHMIIRAWNSWRMGESLAKMPIRKADKVITAQKIRA